MSLASAAGVLRFAALGDSINVGIGSPMPDGGWRGWAALLAPALAAPSWVELHNFAVSGALTRDVAGPQLAATLRLRPQLASIIVGVNDTLRNRFDVAAIQAALTGCVAALTAQGSLVLTARLPVHVDVATHPTVYDRSMWSVDRLHPSERGHRLLARRFAEALAASGFPLAGRPASQPDNPEPTRHAQAWWMASQGTRWVLRRGADLLPGLLGMAAGEWWCGIRGAASTFDDGLRRDVAAALDRMEDRIVA
ncbi:SGNH/GDSL hydrolase family protein [Planosporangium sp. 12N6]|uniref:SGNH/GDSL hydrolase family protein n=1 Tax=Planosporangium spinosum TaxID=3402278 RepID=UPI003CF4CCD3